MNTGAFAIKADVLDVRAKDFLFANQKTMYGGKFIAVGDTIFLFDSENEGGSGLLAVGVVTAAAAVPKVPRLTRQNPRVNIGIGNIIPTKQSLGRVELKRYVEWDDGKPESELNFKFYRQATNKIIGISDRAAEFLRKYF